MTVESLMNPFGPLPLPRWRSTILWPLLLLGVACQTRQPASMVLVTLDTTRADHLGVYGHTSAHTPALDALAAHGVRFQRAYTPVPLTIPAHSSILTGLYPTRHGVHSNGDAILPEGLTTLAETLQAAHYHTAACVSAFVTTWLWNLDQGFDAYFDDVVGHGRARNRWMKERPADQVVDDAVAWLSTVPQEEPWFLWVHFYDPHEPYLPPEPWATEYAEAPYDGEIAFMDQEIGRLQAAVQARQQRVHWIAVGDHGEALTDEQGELGHGLFLYEATTHVPFIVRPAEPLEQPRAIPDPVSLVDVLPTALGLLGQPVPQGLDGRDLSPLLRGEALPPRAGLYMESETAQRRFGYHPEVGLVRGPLKLLDTPHPRLFNVLADPQERHNLLDDDPSLAEPLRQELAGFSAERGEADLFSPAPEITEQLVALGYVEAAFQLPTATSDIDAKDRVETIQALERVRFLAADPAHASEVEALYRDIMASEPQLVEASMGLANVLQVQDRNEEAIVVYEEAIGRQPDSTVLRVGYANCLAAMGRLEPGLEVMRAVLEQVPEDDVARVGMLRMLADLGREQEALELVNDWLVQAPEDPTLLAHRGVLLGMLGDLESAEAPLRASLMDGVPRQMVHHMLAHVHLSRSEPVQAVAELRGELEGFPQRHDARELLAKILMTLGAWEEAAAEFEYLADTHPDNVAYPLSWAQAVFNAGEFERAQDILAPALTRVPPHSEVLLLQANILGKLGRHAEAEQVFAAARARHADEAARSPE